MRFGEMVRSARESAGLTQRACAAALGVSGAYLSMVECGTAPPMNPSRIVQFCRSAGVDPRPMLRAEAEARREWRIPLPSSPLASAVLSGLAALGTDAGDGEVRGVLEGVLRG